MRVTATEAENRFGCLCAQAKREPVFVEKAGRLDTVILSAEHWRALQAGHDQAGRAARGTAFEAEYGDSIPTQNARFHTHVIPGADLRPWCAADGAVRRLHQPQPQRGRGHPLRGPPARRSNPPQLSRRAPAASR